MTARYHEFRGDQWLAQAMRLDGGSVRLVADDYLQSADSPMAYARAGRKATVYKVSRNGRYMAMKVFKKKYALVENILTTMQLNALKSRPGLRVCDRQFINAAEADALGEPGLAWAILMPWVDGDPWTALVESKRAVPQNQCLALARNTANILAALEADDYVHADISSTNVFVQGLDDRPHIELIDVEDMYHPRFIDVPSPPDGTAGYAHPKNSGLGCRNPYGDRFAGGILLVEMITWHNNAIRGAAFGDSLFAQQELCQPSTKFDVVKAALDAHSPALGTLFNRLWSSAGLRACPTIEEWKSALAGAGTAQRTIMLREPRSPVRANQAPHQTSLLKQTFCTECKKWVPNFTPTAHAETCSHHPAKFKPLAGIIGVASVPATGKPADTTPDLMDLLQRYTSGLTKCSSCGAFVSGPNDSRHTLLCATRLLAPPSSGQTGAGSLKRSPFLNNLLGNYTPNRCPKCQRVITKNESIETGHKLTCPDGPLAKWWRGA